MVEPAATVTEKGTAKTFAIAPEIDTAVPPAPAILVRVTVQVVAALEGRKAGAHWSEDTSGGIARATVTLADDPLMAAESVAFWSDVN